MYVQICEKDVNFHSVVSGFGTPEEKKMELEVIEDLEIYPPQLSVKVWREGARKTLNVMTTVNGVQPLGIFILLLPSLYG